jgi:hypothetical protein
MSMETGKLPAETYYRCREIAKERDTYRELCGELLKVLVDAQNTLAHCKAGVGYVHRQNDTAIKPEDKQ